MSSMNEMDFLYRINDLPSHGIHQWRLGDLIQVVLPDGMVLSYVIDAATGAVQSMSDKGVA